MNGKKTNKNYPKHLNLKARKDRQYRNRTITSKHPIAERKNRKLTPTVAYCRYANNFVVMIKGTKAQAEATKDECREFLEGKLKLTLNREKIHGTQVNDGFVYLTAIRIDEIMVKKRPYQVS